MMLNQNGDALNKLLDAVGWRILEALQTDARLSYSELGRRVGLSAPAVIERVHKMEDAGIITGYRAQVSLKHIGLDTVAFVRIRARPAAGVDATIEALAQDLPEVLQCHTLTGEDCYLLQVAATSVEHLNQILARFRPYGSLTTSIVLDSPVVQGHVVAPSEE